MNKYQAESKLFGTNRFNPTVTTNSIPDQEVYLQMAELAAVKSKDPSTKVGAVLVSPDRRQIATGYNGFPSRIDDYTAILDKDVTEPLNKYDLVIHAEVNAILNCHCRPEGWALFCTHTPCANCAKIIVASGVKSVVCYNDGPASDMGCDKSELIFGLANIPYVKVSR